MAAPGRAAEILDFWFGPVPGARRRQWFVKDPDFDREIRERFLEDHRRARDRELDDWLAEPASCLALVVLLDQFPRNMFRGAPEAFAADACALAAARHAVEQGFDAGMPAERRLFFYLPFEHSENLDDQRRCVALTEPFRALPGFEDVHDYALRHLRVIQRFGRFPHRNAVLGRTSTPEEADFLKQQGSSF
ncbi:MAG TPA: DUF924 family protein [Burkholderiales bacterium]